MHLSFKKVIILYHTLRMITLCTRYFNIDMHIIILITLHLFNMNLDAEGHKHANIVLVWYLEFAVVFHAVHVH